jgi:single-strand DNA-binding protein
LNQPGQTGREENQGDERMSQEAFATVAGYATADPMLRMTKSGAEVAHVRVACTPRRIDRESGEWQDGQTSYYSVTCWRKLAAAVHASIRKGDPVLVRGRMHTRTWETEGRTVSEVEIVADAMGHDLTRGWARFHRESRPPADIDKELRSGELARHAFDDDRRGEHADSDTEDPGDGYSGSVANDSGPQAPIAPAAGGNILTEQAMVELAEQELAEVPA